MTDRRSEDPEQERARNAVANRLVLRLAFAATFGFAVAEFNDWEFSFLAPMLAVQILAAMPAAPGFRQGIAIPLIIFIAAAVALAMSTLFSGTPSRPAGDHRLGDLLDFLRPEKRRSRHCDAAHPDCVLLRAGHVDDFDRSCARIH